MTDQMTVTDLKARALTAYRAGQEREKAERAAKEAAIRVEDSRRLRHYNELRETMLRQLMAEMGVEPDNTNGMGLTDLGDRVYLYADYLYGNTRMYDEEFSAMMWLRPESWKRERTAWELRAVAYDAGGQMEHSDLIRSLEELGAFLAQVEARRCAEQQAREQQEEDARETEHASAQAEQGAHDEADDEPTWEERYILRHLKDDGWAWADANDLGILDRHGVAYEIVGLTPPGMDETPRALVRAKKDGGGIS